MFNQSTIICPICKKNIPKVKSFTVSPKLYKPSIIISCSCSKYLIKLSTVSFLNITPNLNLKSQQSQITITTNVLKDQTISYYNEISTNISSIKSLFQNSFSTTTTNSFLIKLEYIYDFLLKYKEEIIQFLDLAFNNILIYKDNSIYQSISLNSLQKQAQFFKTLYLSAQNKANNSLCEQELFNYNITISLIKDSNISFNKGIKYYICTPFTFLLSFQKTYSYNKVKHSSKSHHYSIENVCELPNGEIATCGYDTFIKFWNMESFSPYHTISAHNGSVLTLCLIKQNNNNLLASGSSDGLIKIWNFNNKSLFKTLTAHEGGVIQIIQLSNTDIASCSVDTSIRIWNCNSYSSFQLIGHTQTIERIKEIVSDKKDCIELISISLDSTIRIWDIYRKICTLTIDIEFSGLSFDVVNNNIVFFICKGHIMIYDIQKKSICCRFETPKYQAYSIKYIGGNLLSIGCGDNLIRIYDVSNIEELNGPVCIMKTHEETVISLTTLSNDRLCSTSWDGTLSIWEH